FEHLNPLVALRLTAICGVLSFTICRTIAAADPAAAAASPQGGETQQLSFDPLQCKYLDRIQHQLGNWRLTAAQLKLFQRQGFVVLDHSHNSFGDEYHYIYHADLPVLVTSDSLLHVLHCSF